MEAFRKCRCDNEVKHGTYQQCAAKCNRKLESDCQQHQQRDQKPKQSDDIGETPNDRCPSVANKVAENSLEQPLHVRGM